MKERIGLHKDAIRRIALEKLEVVYRNRTSERRRSPISRPRRAGAATTPTAFRRRP